MRHFILLSALLPGCLVGEISLQTDVDPPADTGGSDDSDAPDAPPSVSGTVLAYAGGTSIAIRWANVPGATSYKVQRNGVEIATQTPGFHPEFPEKDGNGVIDKNVTPGVDYLYTVTAIGTTTGQIGGTSATLPMTTTPPPTITIDTSGAPDLADWMQNTVKPFLEIWYPKIGDALALPDYVPPAALTLTIDPNYEGVAYCSGQSIVMSAAYARAHPQDLGAWLHEGTHALQSYQNIPGWITEGIADYTREYILHDRDPRAPGPGNTYLTGYGEGSYFLSWIRDEHDPKFIRALNVAAFAKTYSDDFFVAKTGKTIDALWTAMVGAPLPSTVKFAGLTNMCLQAGNGTTNHVQVATCGTGLAQGFGVIRNNNNTISIANNHNCIDVASSATNNGATVWMYPCNGSGAQQWVQLADGSLQNPASNRCLDNPNASTTSGTSLQLLDCNGSASQRLTRL